MVGCCLFLSGWGPWGDKGLGVSAQKGLGVSAGSGTATAPYSRAGWPPGRSLCRDLGVTVQVPGPRAAMASLLLKHVACRRPARSAHASRSGAGCGGAGLGICSPGRKAALPFGAPESPRRARPPRPPRPHAGGGAPWWRSGATAGWRQPLLRPEEEEKGLGWDSGRPRPELGCSMVGGAGGGMMPSDPADGCHEEHRARRAGQFGFSGPARKVPVGMNQTKETSQRKQEGEPV